MATKNGKKKTAKKAVGKFPTVGQMPVSMRLATHLRELDQLMFAEFGESGSFAYVIQANNKLISASDANHGVVVPDIKREPPEGRLCTPSELWQLPSSSKIVHPTLGVGEVQRVGKRANTDLDDRVAVFEGGERFILPAPVPPECVEPWDQPVRIVLPVGTEIETAWASEV